MLVPGLSGLKKYSVPDSGRYGTSNWRIAMLKLKTAVVAFGAAIVLAATAGYGPAAQAGDWPTEKHCKKVAKDGDTIIKGWCTAITRKAGNCLACHQAMVNPWPEGFPVGGISGHRWLRWQLASPTAMICAPGYGTLPRQTPILRCHRSVDTS